MTQEPCRVLVVDDSAVARMIVRRIVTDSKRFDVVGQASSAEEALNMLRNVEVDIILLDIEMPGMDGIEAIPHLKRRSNGAAILIVSSHCPANTEASVRAMTMGATDTLLKPGAKAFANEFATTLETTMMRIANGRRKTLTQSATTAPLPMPKLRTSSAKSGPVECVALAASTGGLHALTSFFSALPRELEAPIFITQHLPSDFIDYFAAQLRVLTGKETQVAEAGRIVEPATVYIAPGDAHLSLVADGSAVRIGLSVERAASGACPSADPMFGSVARVYGAGAVGVVLSGMGRDGSVGAAELAKAGGEILVQDRESAVVWGMPGAIARHGDADLIAKPELLANRIAHRLEVASWS